MNRTLKYYVDFSSYFADALQQVFLVLLVSPCVLNLGTLTAPCVFEQKNKRISSEQLGTNLKAPFSPSLHPLSRFLVFWVWLVFFFFLIYGFLSVTKGFGLVFLCLERNVNDVSLKFAFNLVLPDV